jgi:hypothetical protein
MVEIVLNSGTTWTVPDDWNNSNNSVQCFGGGAAGQRGSKNQRGNGGGAGAYARGDNLVLTSGSTIQIRIGSGGTGVSNSDNQAPGGDTCFNATSLANAVSNGNGISVAAQGGQGLSGGAATSSVGNHTRTNGGNGASVSGTGTGGSGGACPNGGTGGSGGSTNNPGNNGNPPGGGGGGAGHNTGVGNIAGGSGANGRIVINYEPVPLGKHRMFLVFSWILAFVSPCCSFFSMID